MGKENSQMQVVILAGGKGRRLEPITFTTPKPMIPINGRPFLQYQFELIKTFGLRKVLLLVGHLSGLVERYFGDGSKYGLGIRYSYEKTLLGTGGALKNAEDKIEDVFLLMNGDTYLSIDYKELITAFHKYGKRGLVAAYETSDDALSNNIAISGPNLVVGYNKTNPSGMTHIDAGVSVFRKDILGLIPKGTFCSLEEEIFVKLIERKELAAFPTGQRFYDMGSRDGLKAIERVFR